VVLLQSALVEVLLGRRTREPNLEVSLVSFSSLVSVPDVEINFLLFVLK
jgi:hypothetical protein